MHTGWIIAICFAYMVLGEFTASKLKYNVKATVSENEAGSILRSMRFLWPVIWVILFAMLVIGPLYDRIMKRRMAKKETKGGDTDDTEGQKA